MKKINPIVFESMNFPNPVISISVEPLTKLDQENLSKGLNLNLQRKTQHSK